MNANPHQLHLPAMNHLSDTHSKWNAFPQTRYLGSKKKLLPFLDIIFSEIEFDSALDPFCGTGSVAYLLKTKNAAVTASDALAFNVATARALIENDTVTLDDDITILTDGLPNSDAKTGFVERTFEGIFYLQNENRFIDQFIERLNKWVGYKKDLALFSLGQSALAKRPYNLFHRANLNMRNRNVKRSFGNKATWDRPFDELIRRCASEADNAVFSGSRPCRALQSDVLSLDPDNYDLVYLDPPYISLKGNAVDYLDYYHFLEGITDPESWSEKILHRYKHKPVIGRGESPWCDPARITSMFKQTIERYASSTLVISYRSDGIPSIDDLQQFLKQIGKQTQIFDAGKYTYALSRNNRSREIVIVGR